MPTANGFDSGPGATDLFLTLTPERVLAAVEAAGLSCNPVCYPLNSFENRVYEVELADRGRLIAKFYRPGRWRAEQILEEHRFLAELAAAEVPVCTVLPFPDGSTLKRIDTIYYSLSERRGGRAPDELCDRDVERLGMFVGRMHNVAASSPAPSRPRLDAERYVRRALVWIERQGSLTGGLRQRYFAAAGELAELADRMLAGVATHRIHADLHLGNVLLRDGELRVLDFDDMAEGPAVQDLWLAVPGRDAESQRQRQVFLAGYERFRLFDPRDLSLIEPLRGLRMVRYAGWLARRWHDPAFRSGWPQFGDEEYWQHGVADLEEQLRTIQSEAVRMPGAGPAASPVHLEAEEALSNKDYFWDWEGE